MKINHITTYWHSNDRVVFMTDDFHGLVEIQYPKDEPDLGYIWHLWVDEGYRRKGYATALLDAAENHIALQCMQYAVLDFDKRDTPKSILQWYESRGYNETEFSRNVIRLQKELI